MEIRLNEDLIKRCNDLSMYNRGNHIKDDAEIDFNNFVKKFSNRDLNPQQLDIVKKRTEQFRDFVTNFYNELLNINSNIVPVNIAGPANYNYKKFNRLNDNMNNKINDYIDKSNKFYDNTEKMLKNAYSKDEILNKYRNGYNEPINSDDPLALEKLKSKLEYLEENHQKYKDFNKKARKNGEQQLSPYVLANSNQNIKSVKDRIEKLEKMNNLNDVGYYFNEGEVRYDKTDNRLRIFFDNIPNEETRNILKSNGFKWSPKNKAWQRQLTPQAISRTRYLFKDIGSLEIKKVKDYTEEKNISI